MESRDLAAMREEYASSGLDEQSVGDDPIETFRRWLDDAVAAGLHEPNAMALATATPDGRPSVRIVLLKGVDADGLVFFTSYDSRKGREIDANPRAALTMLWHPLQRQVRVEGAVSRIDAQESDAYFASRPRGSQISAAASPQSQPVADRSDLERRRDAVEQRFGDGPIERPDDWGGYRVAWGSVELWQGRTSRFHDRFRFTRTDDGWVRQRLAP